MSSTFESLFPTLFPLLTLAVTIVLIFYFLYLKKIEGDKPLRAKEVQRTKPYITVPGIETGQPLAPFVKEGFNTSMTFPVWTGASMRFARTMNDRYYKEYKENNLEPSEEFIALVNSLPVVDKMVPNYGSTLSNFDADISTIPWDADNTQYLQKDVVWGHVTHDASASIFLKAYHRKLLSDPDNLVEGDKSAMYHSPILGTSATNETSAALLQAADAAATMMGQSVLDGAKERLEGFVKNTKMDAMARSGTLDNILKARKGGTPSSDFNKLSPRDKKIVQDICDSDDRHSAREAKLNSGKALSPAEEVEHRLFNKHRSHLKGKPPSTGKPGKIKKVLNPLSGADKLKIGGKKAAKLFKSAKAFAKAGSAMAKSIGKTVIKLIVTKLITVLLTLMCVQADAAAVATLGALAFLAIAAHILQALWTALDIISTIVVLTLQVLLPAFMERAMKNGASCTEGKPLDILIEDEFLYFIVTTFIPLGDVMDCFGPYACYKSDGGIIMKTPLYIPQYFADTSLSVYKHQYPPSQRPRGDSLSYKSTADSLPPGWTVTAGIARSPCDPGTWTSSDVDMLCNISTYVPETYCKKSYVPATIVKSSRVPATHVKRTYITTRTRGMPYPVDYIPCQHSNPGSDTTTDIGTQTLDCWQSFGDTSYLSCGCRRWNC